MSRSVSVSRTVDTLTTEDKERIFRSLTNSIGRIHRLTIAHYCAYRSVLRIAAQPDACEPLVRTSIFLDEVEIDLAIGAPRLLTVSKDRDAIMEAGDYLFLYDAFVREGAQGVTSRTDVNALSTRVNAEVCDAINRLLNVAVRRSALAMEIDEVAISQLSPVMSAAIHEGVESVRNQQLAKRELKIALENRITAEVKVSKPMPLKETKLLPNQGIW